jgi:predicted CopG family antitoxin
MMRMKEKPSFSGVIEAHVKLQKVVAPTPLVRLRVDESALWRKCESELFSQIIAE